MAEEEKSDKRQAVALKYDRGKDPAPRVVAKGAGTIAEQIIRIAREHGVAVREDASLAEILSKLDLDAIIPLEAYAAVAEILNYVYRANARAPRPGSGAKPMAKNADSLKKAAFGQVAICRRSLDEGGTGFQGLEESVRLYCEAVARLPRAQAREHAAALESLMREMEDFRKSLTQARDALQDRIEGLGRMKQANVAYQKYDKMGLPFVPKKEKE